MSEEKEIIKMAVVGLGYWGRHYVRITANSPRTELVALCDLFKPSLDKHAASHPGVAACNSVEELLKQDFQAAVVAVNAAAHYDIVKELLSAGKHVLCEKPLTIVLAESIELQRLALENHATLIVGHTFLFNSATLKIKDFVDSGEIGNMSAMYAVRTNMGPFREDVNCIWDLAPHDVSVYQFLLGEPEWACANASKPLRHKTNEDVAFITLGYPNGLLGHIHVSWMDPKKVRTMTFVGTKGRIEFDDMKADQAVTLYKKGVRAKDELDSIDTYGQHKMIMNDGDIFIPALPRTEPLGAQVDYFLDHLGQHEFTSDAKFAVGVVRTMVAIEKSVQNEGSRIYLKDLL